MTMNLGARHGNDKESERRENASDPEASEAPCRSQRGDRSQRVGKPRTGRRATPCEAGASSSSPMIRPGNPGRCGESTQANTSSHGAAGCGASRMHGDHRGDGETQVMLCALSLPTDTSIAPGTSYTRRSQASPTQGSHGPWRPSRWAAMPPWT